MTPAQDARAVIVRPEALHVLTHHLVIISMELFTLTLPAPPVDLARQVPQTLLTVHLAQNQDLTLHLVHHSACFHRLATLLLLIELEPLHAHPGALVELVRTNARNVRLANLPMALIAQNVSSVIKKMP